MNTELQAEAQELINDLFKKGYVLSTIKASLEDDKFLATNFISKDMAEAMHDILSEVNLYDVIIEILDFDNNVIKSLIIRESSDKDIKKTISEIVRKTNGAFYGRQSKFFSIV